MTLIDRTAQYDPTERDRTPVTPSLAGMVRLGLQGLGQDLRVCMPCRVVAVHGPYRVDVQPLTQAQYLAAKAPTTLPIIPGVPVCMPGGVNFQVKYPIDTGDVGLCIFADRAIDTFLAGSGQPTDPADARTHDLTDAIYLPGLTYDSLAAERADKTDDLVLRNGTAEVRLERDGQFRIYSGGANNLELVDLIGQLAAHCEKLVQTLQGAVLTTPVGPGAFAASTQFLFNDALATVTLLRQSLGKIKGM